MRFPVWDSAHGRRRLTGIKKRGEFDAIVNRLQMQGYVITADFEYAKDKYGNAYGWGLSGFYASFTCW